MAATWPRCLMATFTLPQAPLRRPTRSTRVAVQQTRHRVFQTQRTRCGGRSDPVAASLRCDMQMLLWQAVAAVECLADSQAVLFASGLLAHVSTRSHRANPGFFDPYHWTPPIVRFSSIACGHSHVLGIATNEHNVRGEPLENVGATLTRGVWLVLYRCAGRSLCVGREQQGPARFGRAWSVR